MLFLYHALHLNANSTIEPIAVNKLHLLLKSSFNINCFAIKMKIRKGLFMIIYYHSSVHKCMTGIPLNQRTAGSAESNLYKTKFK